MIEQIKQSWQQFKDSEPGHRFQDRYERRHQTEHGRWTTGAVVNVVLGAAIVLAGLFLVVAPGPGSLITIFGLGLLGSEFAPIARALDWSEVRVRRIADWAKDIWDRSSPGVKALIVLVGVLCVAAAGYGAYRLLMG